LLSHLPNREEELAQILYSKAFDYLYDRLMWLLFWDVVLDKFN
jgi:hypothetical protein